MAFRWIHLSDLHFGAGDENTKAHRETVLFKLKADIAALQARLGAPQFIWVTGDIAQKGDAKEYTAAKKWLDEIRQTTGAKVFVVPGNHDVARGAVLADKNSLRLHGALRRGEENLDNALVDAGDRALLSAKLQNFLSFAQHYGWQPGQLWQKVEFPDQQLTILGLNTALLSLDNQDSPQNLALGQQQLNELVQAPGLAVVLGHHPPEWLKDGKDLLGHLGNRAHLGFFGHVHEAGGGPNLGFGGQHLPLRAAAAHAPIGQEGYGYAWGALDPTGLRYYPRQWSKMRGEFIANNHQGDLDPQEGLLRAPVQLPRALQTWLSPNGAPGLGGKGKIDPRITFLGGGGSKVQALQELLPSYVLERGDRTNPATLLNARYQVVDFVDSVRQAELTFLQGWCDRSDRLAAQLFTGPGGAGKTRLMIEWCQRLQKQGWVAGFWGDQADQEKFKQVAATSQPAFLVVDYAESRHHLGALLKFLAALPQQGQKIRVALLARHESDWWTNLKNTSDEVGHLLNASPQPLGSAQPTATELYHHAARKFAELKKQTPPTRPTFNLSEPLFAEPLYVVMAALADVEGWPLTADTLLDGVVNHEVQLWDKAVEPLTDDARELFRAAARRTVAALVLRGGARDVGEFKNLLKLSEGPEQPTWARRVYKLYPGKNDGSSAHHLSPLEPDLLGEALVAQVLADPQTPADFLEKIFADQPAATLQTGFTVLGRLGAHNPNAERGIQRLLRDNLKDKLLPAVQACLAVGQKTALSPLGPRLAEAAEQQNPAALAAAVERLIPDQTVSLARLGVWALEAQLNATTEPRERARLLNNLGVKLDALGRRQEALDATQEAVQIRRPLAQKHPDTFAPDLAMSLGNLGVDLSALGRRQEALNATQEAVQLYRPLAQKHPDTFAPALAGCLNNLGAMLNALGRRQEALDATLEAVQLYRPLAQKHPDTFAPALAGCLNNLGAMLNALGRRQEALEATQEAVQIYRPLAQKHPDTFAPDLATSLNNLGLWLSELGRRQEALEATLEAVQIRRPLAQKHPDTFAPDLANSLSNLGVRWSALGRRQEALAATQEAVQLYRPLAQKHPDTFAPDLAMSLNNQGKMLSELGRRQESLAATLEAVQLYRPLAQKHPDTFAPALAGCLNNLGAMLNALGRRQEALDATLEAVQLYRSLAQKHPDTFAPDLAISLNNLGARLSELDRHPEALAVSRDAVQTYLQFFRRVPAALPALAEQFTGTFGNLGGRLKTAGLDPAQDPDWVAAQALLREAGLGHEG